MRIVDEELDALMLPDRVIEKEMLIDPVVAEERKNESTKHGLKHQQTTNTASPSGLVLESWITYLGRWLSRGMQK